MTICVLIRPALKTTGHESLMENRLRIRRTADKLKEQALILFSLVAAAWLLEIVDVLLLHQALDAFGVWPRRAAGLWGILLMPLLHGGLAHVAANTVPFIVLGWLVMLRRSRDFILVTAITMLVTGFGLWLFGSPQVVYIGASSLIFGYFSFLLLRGYYERSPQSIFVALLVAFFYGGKLIC
jgi:membrane associated rhomboid family serine protease